MTDACAVAQSGQVRRYLCAGVHGVIIRQDLVLLDTRSDGYLCLPDIGGATLSDEVLSCSFALAAQLDAEGLTRATFAPHPYPVRAIPARPSLACRTEVSQPLPVPVIASFVDRWARLAVRQPDIAVLAQQVGGRPRSPADMGLLVDRVDSFRRLSPAMPWVGACLFQSWMLLNWVQRAGLDATWVFGVRTWPFAAHCWLQVDDICLTDAPEALEAYHPILAL